MLYCKINIPAPDHTDSGNASQVMAFKLSMSLFYDATVGASGNSDSSWRRILMPCWAVEVKLPFALFEHAGTTHETRKMSEPSPL